MISAAAANSSSEKGLRHIALLPAGFGGLLFLLPCIYILPPLLESESGVWYSFPISDTISAIITALLGWNLLVKLGKLKDGDDPDILGSQI